MKIDLATFSLSLVGATAAADVVARHGEWKRSPFTIDYFGRRLAEARKLAADDDGNPFAAPGGEEVAVVTDAPEPLTCDEGFDDDATLAAHPLASQYGLTGCAQTYDMLMEFMGNDDMLCKVRKY